MGIRTISFVTLLVGVPIALFLLLSLNGNILPMGGSEGKIIYVRTTPLKVTVAETPEARARGLSERPSLPANEGLLFVFPAPAEVGIWMKDMHFPIDIIWVGDDRRIVDIKKNAPVGSYPEVFRPRFPARYVIEVNAGWTEAYSVAIGDEVDLSAILP